MVQEQQAKIFGGNELPGHNVEAIASKQFIA
jgi:hypothetical protein